MRDVLAGSWNMLTTAWRMDRRKTIISVLLMVSGAAAAPLLAAALGRMADDIFAGRAAEAAVAGSIVAVLAIMSLTFAHFAHIAYFELSELAELDFDEQLIAVSNGSPGIEHHERHEQADALTVLAQESRQYQAGLEALLNSLGLALAVVLTAILLATANPWLLLLPLAAIPPLVTGRIAERILDRTKTRTAEQTRGALHLFQLSTSAQFAGELRVFGLRDELLRRHTELWQGATDGLWRGHAMATWIRAAGQVVFALAYVGAVLLVVRDTIVGRRGVGDVVLVLTLAVQVNQQVSAAVSLLRDLQRMSSAYRRLAGLRASVTPDEPLPADQAPPARLSTGLTLQGVSFAYPGTDTYALRDVDLTLPAGATVAIVGENGAGKTSLVKLLCGFYQPTSGQVLLDGTDLRRVPVEQWRERIAAGFQDFVRYELTVQHAVGVGDLPRVSSEEAVRDALDRAHATGVLEQLTDGVRTQLGKSYADGAELSGGQWQKVALGRALMRPTPLLLVLDEPTSALDPEAEHALFERYAEQARLAAATTGTITLFVSHRFSTVRMADLIVVVRDGRVVESGPHDALMANGGLYAELFGIQAAAYR
ncbi:ABC transporter ATP-binding protein [Micromonospora sp. NPDC049523]|uniref:ABC transporter ATP-binding protein n=1 Tax=Micromonospora sp. NPDC049523 TaxID=3155921 RepID=UPI0034280681